MINIAGLDKAAVLAALHNASQSQGIGSIHDLRRDMTLEFASVLIGFRERDRAGLYFDYVEGRVIKTDISGDSFDPRLFDRDNGDGAAARAIEALRT